jgi:Helix-turn-helix domain/Domain of unknown function (DUF6597)
MARVVPLGAHQQLAPGGEAGRWEPRRHAVRAVVPAVWTHVIPHHVSELRVLPDAGVDLVFAGGDLRVAGPDTKPYIERLPAGRPVLGFRIRPGAVAGVLGVPASDVLDDRVEVVELWGDDGRRVVDAMLDTGDVHGASEAFESMLAARLAAVDVDPLADALAQWAQQPGRLDAFDLGLSERQLRRRCITAFGYGPTTLRRILRFQRAVHLLQSSPALSLADVALASGHADQAHMTNEFNELGGLTPRQMRQLTLDQVSLVA